MMDCLSAAKIRETYFRIGSNGVKENKEKKVEINYSVF
jgi:hypothetical protein